MILKTVKLKLRKKYNDNSTYDNDECEIDWKYSEGYIYETLGNSMVMLQLYAMKNPYLNNMQRNGMRNIQIYIKLNCIRG